MAMKNFSVVTVVTATLIVVTTVLLGTYASVTFITLKHQEEARLQSTLANSVEQLSSGLLLPVWNFDIAQLRKVIETQMQEKSIAGIDVKAGNNVYAVGRDDQWRPVARDGSTPESDMLIAERVITYENEPIGSVTIYVTPRFIKEELQRSISNLVAVILILDIFLVVIMYVVLWRIVLKPLRTIEQFALDIEGANGKTKGLENSRFQGEFESVRQSIQKMTALLGSRHSELMETNNLLRTEIEDGLRKEAANRQLKEYFESIFNFNPLSIAISRMSDGLFIDVNHMFEVYNGWTREEVIGKTVDQIELWVHPGERKEFINSLLEHEYARNRESVFRRKDGNLHTVLLSSTKVEFFGVPHIISISQDVTELRNAQEKTRQQQLLLIQADKMASLGMLVSGIAHEINNPNNLVMFNGDLISRTFKDVLPILDEYFEAHPDRLLSGLSYEKTRKGMDNLLIGLSVGACRIRDIVSSLKDLARINTGNMNEEIRINEVVQAAFVIVENLVRKSTDNFSVAHDDAVPSVIGNIQQIEQVIINLMTNAAQSLTDRSQAIRVTTRYNREEGKVIVIVSDEGIGIPPENLKRLFDPFYTTKRDSGGTGLGLSISYSIVQAHKGDLLVHSIEGEGTTMSLCLPVGILEKIQ